MLARSAGENLKLGGGCPGKASPWRAASSKHSGGCEGASGGDGRGKSTQAEGTASAEASGVSEAGAWRRVRLRF